MTPEGEFQQVVLSQAAHVPCESCGQHPGTEKWVGDGGALALVHGAYQRWCKGCVLRAQIAYATEVAGKLLDMKVELHEWERANRK